MSSEFEHTTKNCKILVIDDESSVRFGIRDFLETHGFEVQEAAERRVAQEMFVNNRPDAVILDYLLGDGDTLDLMARLKKLDAGVPVLILTAHGSIDLAVRAMKLGADQFLTKPMDLQALLLLLRREINTYRGRRKSEACQRREQRNGVINPFVGGSRIIKQLEEQAHQIRGYDASMLLYGETGTGKGVMARWLHANSPRAEESFVDLNCALLSRELMESELFGHERGSFTGATQTKLGLLEIGDRGTVFLDEIGDMDIHIQPKLLTVLDEKRFRRLGEVKKRRVDIRLIAATNQNLQELMVNKKFRNDLYFRINTLTLTMPALRDRKEDIIPLAREILQTLAVDLGRNPVLSHDAEGALLRYDWPGNIRELRNVLERAVLLNRAEVLLPSDLRFEAAVAGYPLESSASALTLADLERRHIEQVLASETGHVERAAAKLGIPRSSLYDKLKRYSMEG